MAKMETLIASGINIRVTVGKKDLSVRLNLPGRLDIL